MRRFVVIAFLACACLSAYARDCLVAIDAGHTREEPGATSARGVGEWHFNIALAQKLAVSLDNAKIPCVLINPAGDAIPLTSRPEAAQKAGATLLLSLHHDAVQPRYLSEWTWGGKTHFYSDNFSGYSLFVSAQNPYYRESLDVAREMADNLLGKNLAPTLHHAEPEDGENRLLLDSRRGIYQFDELVVLRESSLAAVLVEVGVIVNREEELLVSTPAYQDKITGALVTAIEAHCRRMRN